MALKKINTGNPFERFSRKVTRDNVISKSLVDIQREILQKNESKYPQEIVALRKKISNILGKFTNLVLDDIYPPQEASTVEELFHMYSVLGGIHSIFDDFLKEFQNDAFTPKRIELMKSGNVGNVVMKMWEEIQKVIEKIMELEEELAHGVSTKRRKKILSMIREYYSEIDQFELNVSVPTGVEFLSSDETLENRKNFMETVVHGVAFDLNFGLKHKGDYYIEEKEEQLAKLEKTIRENIQSVCDLEMDEILLPDEIIEKYSEERMVRAMDLLSEYYEDFINDFMMKVIDEKKGSQGMSKAEVIGSVNADKLEQSFVKDYMNSMSMEDFITLFSFTTKEFESLVYLCRGIIEEFHNTSVDILKKEAPLTNATQAAQAVLIMVDYWVDVKDPGLKKLQAIEVKLNLSEGVVKENSSPRRPVYISEARGTQHRKKVFKTINVDSSF